MSMANNPELYEDDVVVLLDEDGEEVPNTYGIVLETAWSSQRDDDDEEKQQDKDNSENHEHGEGGDDNNDEDDDDEEEDEEDEDEEDDRLSPGHIRVAWPDRLSDELSASQVRLVDRSFLHGDVVVRRGVAESDKSIGCIREVHIDAVLEFGKGMENAQQITVDTEVLEPPHPYIIGRYVVKGSMLGVIHDCFLDVEFAFGRDSTAPKAICLVTSPSPDVFKPQLDNGEELSEEEVGHACFYPGIKVRARHAQWKKSKWLMGTHSSATTAGDEGTVIKITPNSISVEWLSGLQEWREDAYEIINDLSGIVCLDLWEAARWQVGDHCTLTPAALEQQLARLTSLSSASADDAKSSEPTPNSPGGPPTPSASSSSSSASTSSTSTSSNSQFSKVFHYPGTILRTSTRVSVEWQDGSIEHNILAVDLIPRDYLLDNDFIPHDFVVIKPSNRLCVVQHVNARERMVRIRYLSPELKQSDGGNWWNREVNNNNSADDEAETQHDPATMPPPNSDVELEAIPPHAPLDAQTRALIHQQEQHPEGYEEWMPAYDMSSPRNFEFSLGSLVVRVPGVTDERTAAVLGPDARLGFAGQVLEMKDGKITVQWPHDHTTSVYNPDQLLIIEPDDDDSDEEEEEDGEDEDGEDEEDEEAEAEEEAADDANVEAPQDEFPSEWMQQKHWKSADTNNNNNTPNSPQNDTSASDTPTAPSSTGAVPSSSSSSSSSSVNHPNLLSYSSFAIVDSPPPATHHYLSQPFQPADSKRFTKRVRQEWKSLSENLPPGIHVRTFDSRMDLFAIIIAGPKNTPYYLSVFQFDLFLPSTYPDEPPQMFFYSRGHRMNPNLYLDGNICLSLLNTWNGKGTQRWCDTSNLLQLFVSLQGLVLGVSDPYYLEAGYDKQKGWAQAALSSHLYNETALLLSLQHLISYLPITTSQIQQDTLFGEMMYDHAKNPQVQSELNDLIDISAKWELRKKHDMEKFQSANASSNNTSSPSSDAVSNISSALSTSTLNDTVELDIPRLISILKDYAIRTDTPVTSTSSLPVIANDSNASAPSSSSSSTSSTPADQAASSAAPSTSSSTSTSSLPSTPVVHYHPTLGFITMLSRTCRNLRAALDKINNH